MKFSTFDQGWVSRSVLSQGKRAGVGDMFCNRHFPKYYCTVITNVEAINFHHRDRQLGQP